jgi:D-glycero-alpha-D-manno-heptose-7-phosphate kinase
MLIVRSPVRISFGGGGTDLPGYYEKYGGAVLSAAINKYFYTVLTKRTDDKIQVISSDLRIIETWQDIASLHVKGSDLDIPLAVMKELEVHTPLNLFLASEILPGTGLGSSASVCVNILKALSTYLQLPMTKYELAEKAFHIARDVLQLPIGKQDEYAASFGGINFISFCEDGRTTVEPLAVPPDVLRELQGNLMLFFTGASHNSWSILKEQENSTKRPAGPALDSLRQIQLLAKSMQTALMKGNLKEFAGLLDEGWQAKRRVSTQISNLRIDSLYDLARQNGASGGKITGAGGGGFLLLYCEKEDQQKVRDAFAREGLREMTFEFDFQGARVLVNDPFLDNDGRCGLRWTFVPYREPCVSDIAEPS